MPHQPDYIDVFLQPGEYFVGDAQYRIRTLLGSCVSIVLWHPIRRIGAMSHFLLPSRRKSAQGPLDARYGEEVMALMVHDLAALQIKPAECKAKIFGGGNMFPLHAERDPFQIGQRNGEAARALLASHGITTVDESLFGTGHRQIIFTVETGVVWSRQVKPAAMALYDLQGDLG